MIICIPLVAYNIDVVHAAEDDTTTAEPSEEECEGVSTSQEQITNALIFYRSIQALQACSTLYGFYNQNGATANWTPENIGESGGPYYIETGTDGGQQACTTDNMEALSKRAGLSTGFLEAARTVAGCDAGSTCNNNITIAQIRDAISNAITSGSDLDIGGGSDIYRFRMIYDTFVIQCTDGGFSKANEDSSSSGDLWHLDSGPYLSEGEYLLAEVTAKKSCGGLFNSCDSTMTIGPTMPETIPGLTLTDAQRQVLQNNNKQFTMSCNEMNDTLEGSGGEYITSRKCAGDELEDLTDVETSPSEVATTTDEGTCNSKLGIFGWIFCPGANLVSELINGMVGWIADSMKWTILADDSATNTAGLTVRQVWQNFLNIANVVFVIAFLIMIYSMATSTGLSNYDVKKMLPRLIIVAIAVNLSFYICAALVDLSNIIGAGLYSLIYGQSVSEPWTNLGGIVDEIFSDIGSIVLIILAFCLFGGTAIIGIAIILLLIMFRQIALMALVIISPVAFAMYMLPNTQKWADKWKDMFVRLLIVYPMFTAVWGAAHLAADTFQGTTGLIPGFIVSLICAVAPVVAIIPLFKMSGGLMAMAAGALGGVAAKTGIAKGINKAGRHAVVNNPATRGITRGISNAAGRFGANNIQSTKGNIITRSARNWAGRKALGIANATNKHADAVNSEIRALDNTAMEAAKNDIARYDSNQLLAIAKGGVMPDGSAANQYVQRAAMESAAKSMSANDVRDMMVNSAEQAAKLKQEGRDREAQALLNAAASAASESGNWLGGQGALNNFRDGKWGDNATQAYTNAVASQAGNISKDALSKTSANNQMHMQQQLAAAQQAGNAGADNQISHFREASAQVQADPKAMGNMKLDAQQQLTVNQTMRTTNEQRAANGIGLDAIRSNINQAQKAYDSAVQTGNQAAITQAKTVLDGAHKQMAELGDKILTDNTAMQYFNNLSPADKSYVNRETLRWQGMSNL